mgnify:CR=1 FL=1
MTKKKTPKQPGPAPERLIIEGDWEENARKALEKARPSEGWPKPTKKGGEKTKKKS